MIVSGGRVSLLLEMPSVVRSWAPVVAASLVGVVALAAIGALAVGLGALPAGIASISHYWLIGSGCMITLLFCCIHRANRPAPAPKPPSYEEIASQIAHQSQPITGVLSTTSSNEELLPQEMVPGPCLDLATVMDWRSDRQENLLVAACRKHDWKTTLGILNLPGLSKDALAKLLQNSMGRDSPLIIMASDTSTPPRIMNAVCTAIEQLPDRDRAMILNTAVSDHNKGFEEHTPLTRAIQTNQLILVWRLLCLGASIDQVSIEGYLCRTLSTPVYCAAAHNRHHALKLLLLHWYLIQTHSANSFLAGNATDLPQDHDSHTDQEMRGAGEGRGGAIREVLHPAPDQDEMEFARRIEQAWDRGNRFRMLPQQDAEALKKVINLQAQSGYAGGGVMGTPLMAALKAGHFEAANTLYETGLADTDGADDHGNNHIMLAAQGGNPKNVEAILTHGISKKDLSCTDASGHTALMHAITGARQPGLQQADYERIVVLLLSCMQQLGVPWDIVTKTRYNAVTYALHCQCSCTLLQKLISGIEQPQSDRWPYYRTSMFCAAYAGRFDLVEDAIGHKLSPDLGQTPSDGHGATLLISAILSCHPNFLSFLEEDFSKSALAEALITQCLDLPLRQTPTDRLQKRSVLYHILARHEYCFASTLLAHITQTDPTAENIIVAYLNNTEEPLLLAALGCCTEDTAKDPFLDFLLAHIKADSIDASDPQYASTPLLCAVQKGHLNMVKKLVARGAALTKTVSGFPGQPPLNAYQLAEYLYGTDHAVTQYLATIANQEQTTT